MCVLFSGSLAEENFSYFSPLPASWPGVSTPRISEAAGYVLLCILYSIGYTIFYFFLFPKMNEI